MSASKKSEQATVVSTGDGQPATALRARRGASRLAEGAMPSSLEIAQAAEMQPVESIAESIGLLPEEVQPYGRYKAKINLTALERLSATKEGKLICVAGMTPTRAGEGKTTTAVSLTQGLGVIGLIAPAA
jgi:hypothetical protein